MWKVLLGSVIGGRIFDTLERKFSRTFSRRILRGFSTELKFGLTSASSVGSVLSTVLKLQFCVLYQNFNQYSVVV
jgi:hypothetical protein